MNDLKAYLEIPEHERDFHKGVDLYDKYGKNIRYKRITFPTGNIPAIRNILMYELSKILREEYGEVAIEKPKAEKVIAPVLVSVKENNPSGWLKKEFPTLDFLTLPDTLKILVVDRIALYNNAVKAREAMNDKTLSESQLFELNQINIECRLKNKQIWDELNHYATHKQILGVNPVFKRDTELKRLQKLTRDELFKFVTNTPPFISKKRSAIKKSNDPLVYQKINEAIEFREWQLAECNKLLGIK